MSYMMGGNNAPKIAIVSQKLTATHNGASTGGAWYTLPINTEEYDPFNLLSLSTNQITLEKGEYYVDGNASLMRGNQGSVRLYNVSDSVEALPGNPVYPTYECINYHVSGILDISAQKIFRMEYNVQTSQATYGLGISGNGGGTDRYLNLKFTKIG